MSTSSCSKLPIVTVVLLTFVSICIQEESMYTFWPRTPMSQFRRYQRSLTMFNCRDKPLSRLRMPFDVVSQVPKFNKLPGMIYYPNRTGLIHLHNMALNRAFFFSYILQTFNESNSDFPFVPGMLYIYLSAAADVTANPKVINGSVLMYGVNSFYPNFYTNLGFNQTLNLFAVRAMRIDNTFQTANFIREPNFQTIRIYDLGGQMGLNYTWESYRNGPWYGRGANTPDFLPDSNDRNTVGVKTHRYIIDIQWTPTVKTGSSFFGPPYPGQLEHKHLPVRFTQPWFDCGDLTKAFNEWVSSAVAPVADYMPRYAKDRNMQFPKYVAIAAMDTFFLNIPVNLCPVTEGNPGPNLLAGSDVCHSPSTVCESRLRSGMVQFRSGSFRCRCKAGYRYPYPYRETPWTGSTFRRATGREYEQFFKCLPIRNRMLWPSTPGLHERGEKRGYVEVRLTRRRRSVNDSLAAGIQPEDEEDTEQRHILKMKERIARTEQALREHYNGSDIDEILHGGTDYELVQREARKLVSRFSQPSSSARKRIIPRFNADWLPYSTHDVPKTKKRSRLVSRMKRGTDAREVTFNNYQFGKTKDIFKRFKEIKANTCHKYGPSDLIMPNTVAYGATSQFHGQAAVALRLAHFLSAFLQLNDEQVISGVRLGQRLHKQHIIGEAIGNVAGDIRIVSSGVFFDRSKFVDSKGQRQEFFGPLVYRKGDLAAASFQTRDTANFGEGYHQETWFKVLKKRWATNPYGLEKFRLEAFMRQNFKSDSQTRIPYYPMIFHAPRITDGYWTEPYFDCHGPIKKWLITYAAPFFGQNIGKLEFMGVVTTSIELKYLDVNQCAGNFYQANFFKDTALCDPVSTFCTPVIGYGFQWGSYRCHCRAGYELPFLGMKWFFLGTLLETEYEKMIAKQPNIFPIMKCRQANGVLLNPSLLLIYSLILLCLIALRH